MSRPRIEMYELLAVEESPIKDTYLDEVTEEQRTVWHDWVGDLPFAFGSVVMELTAVDKHNCWECGMANVGYQLSADDQVRWRPTWLLRELDVVPRPVAMLCEGCAPCTPRGPFTLATRN